MSKKYGRKTIKVEIVRFHCGVALIDESHRTKGAKKDVWRALGRMKTVRLLLRPWFVAISGTVLQSNPDDLVGSTSIFSDDSWEAENHAFRLLRPSKLQKAALLINRFRNGTKSGDIHAQVTESIKKVRKGSPQCFPTAYKPAYGCARTH